MESNGDATQFTSPRLTARPHARPGAAGAASTTSRPAVAKLSARSAVLDGGVAVTVRLAARPGPRRERLLRQDDAVVGEDGKTYLAREVEAPRSKQRLKRASWVSSERRLAEVAHGHPERLERVAGHSKAWHERKRGDCICTNDVVIRTDAVDAAVLKTVGEVLDSRVIGKSIELAIARLEGCRVQLTSQRDRLRAELDDVDGRLARLVEALVNGSPMDTVVAQIKVEEERKRALVAEYEALDGAGAPEAFDYATIVRELRERTADVQARS